MTTMMMTSSPRDVCCCYVMRDRYATTPATRFPGLLVRGSFYILVIPNMKPRWRRDTCVGLSQGVSSASFTTAVDVPVNLGPPTQSESAAAIVPPSRIHSAGLSSRAK